MAAGRAKNDYINMKIITGRERGAFRLIAAEHAVIKPDD